MTVRYVLRDEKQKNTKPFRKLAESLKRVFYGRYNNTRLSPSKEKCKYLSTFSLGTCIMC